MKPLLVATLLLLSAAACSRGADDPARAAPELPAAAAADAPAAAVAASPDADATGMLEAYHWRLDAAAAADGARIDALFSGSAPPLQLDFAEGRISIGNSCNRMGGGYAVAGDQLRIGMLMSTMMACTDEALMRRDQAVSTRLEGEVAVTLREIDGTARLTLTTGLGDMLEFVGHPTPETRYGGLGETVFLEVAARTRPCSHPLMPGHECLQVREIGFDEQGLRTGVAGEFEHFYADIEGYSHQPGVRNVLRVRRFVRDPAPADASAHVYVLDLVVESAQEEP